MENNENIILEEEVKKNEKIEEPNNKNFVPETIQNQYKKNYEDFIKENKIDTKTTSINPKLTNEKYIKNAVNILQEYLDKPKEIWNLNKNEKNFLLTIQKDLTQNKKLENIVEDILKKNPQKSKQIENIYLKNFNKGYKKFIPHQKLKNKNEIKSEVQNSSKKNIISEKDIPQSVKNYLQDKNVTLNEKEYTSKLYNFTKKFLSYNFDNVNAFTNYPERRSSMEKICNQYKKVTSEEERKKNFNKFISNPKNKEDLIIIGNMYALQLKNNIKNWEKDKTEYEKESTNKNEFLIENDLHPLQQNGIIPPYIINADTNRIFPGAHQMALQADNIVNNEKNTHFTSLSSAFQKGYGLVPEQNTHKKYTVVEYPQQANGTKIYEIFVPSKKFMKQQKSEAEDLAKLIANNKIDEAKFIKKYGHPPAYPNSITNNNNQQSLADIKFNPPQKDPSQLTIKELVQVNNNLFNIAMITQTPYKPFVDFSKEPHKSQFKEFAKTNPEELEKINNNSYGDIKQEIVKHNSNDNKNTNIEQNSNENNMTQKRKK